MSIAMSTLFTLIERAAELLPGVDGLHWKQLLASPWMATDGNGLMVLVPKLPVVAHNDLRHSFCCAENGCRKRTTPPSVRFLGPKVYLGAIVALVTALRHGTARTRVAPGSSGARSARSAHARAMADVVA